MLKSCAALFRRSFKVLEGQQPPMSLHMAALQDEVLRLKGLVESRNAERARATLEAALLSQIAQLRKELGIAA